MKRRSVAKYSERENILHGEYLKWDHESAFTVPKPHVDVKIAVHIGIISGS